MIEVIAPARARLLARLFKGQHRDVTELRIGRVAVFANQHLLARPSGRKRSTFMVHQYRHRLHVVAEERLARIRSHENGGAKRRGRASSHQRQLDASIAVQVLGGAQALEVEAGGCASQSSEPSSR